MRAGWVWAAATVTALGALAGCAGDQPKTPASAPSALTSAPGSAFLQPGLRFSKDSVNAYREELARVDGKLAAGDDVLGHGWAVCQDIVLDETEAQVVQNAAARFEVSEAVARQIVAAAKSHLCL